MVEASFDRLLEWLLSQDLISIIVLLLLVRSEMRTREALYALRLLDKLGDPLTPTPKTTLM